MRLASIFSDNAVFQRHQYIPVWGEATPGGKVTATFAGNRATTRASAAGRFMLRLPPLPAGGPYELTVAAETPGESVTLKNILVGEVWLASGQSNMQYCLGSDWAKYANVEEQKNALSRRQEKEYVAGIDPRGLIRAVLVPMRATGVRQDSQAGKWEVVTPETAPNHTAVGLWFAKFVQEKLGVPVGIINSSYGGTIAEAWTSRAGLLRNPETAGLVALQDQKYGEDSLWDIDFENIEKKEILFSMFTEKDRGNSSFGKGWAEPDFADHGWLPMRIPGDWIQQKIAVNGAVWVRREVEIPAAWAGKEVFLRLGGIDKQDTTYFNGTEVGRTGKDFEAEYWNMPRAYRIPGSLVKAGRNVIAVRAYSFAYDGGFNGIEDMYRLELVETREKISIAGTWKATAEYEIGRFANPPALAYGPGNPDSPSILFDGMIRPLLSYGLRGVVWYQGESNAHSIGESLAYRRKIRTLIEDWRYQFAQGDFPFIQVELANYRSAASYDGRSSWAPLREAQHAVCRDLSGVYLASAIDSGSDNDIHPQDKKTVGYRLAQVAFHEVYHDVDAVPAGPEFRDYAREGDKIRVRFHNARGLRFAGGAPKGFFMAGGDRNFRPADQVSIEGDSILLGCEGMAAPLAVRYAWADNPDGNLYNDSGLPCGTFRTDEWPL